MHKREFLRTLGGGALGLVIGPDIAARMARVAGVAPAELARDEPFWEAIRASYRLPTEFINLESGYFSMQAQPVLEAFIGHVRMLNAEAAHYMRTVMTADKARVQARLAAMAGCGADELVITRNTTESLGTVIHGIDLEPGSEAVMCNQDYGSMLEQFRQQARRRGWKLTEVDVPLHPRDDQDIVDVYARAITPRTRLLLVSHMINITGHILPVRKIADMAHAHGVGVIVDAAHSFAQLDFTLPQLDGDYLGASLHKWLCTPLGAGLLYVKRDKIRNVWPLLGDTSVPDDDIRKLERLGTQPSWTLLAIADAIRFHTMVGAARKEARLRYLQQYWTDRVRDIRGVYLNTPGGHRACAIANVGITGMTPAALATALFDRHRIYTVAIDTGPVKGTRVTPHLFTTTADLDALVTALGALAKG